ncbi:MAG: DUF4446 family protein [Candidatus Pacebacteria bacterium]|nr:DUF4446 family protein [Candidatus Paceibacterota bacterium]
MFFGKKQEKKAITTIEEASDYIEKLEKRMSELEERLSQDEEKSNLFFEKFELIRYNPFNEVGGDQSFSLAFMNNEDDGFVFTSIYTKDGNRLYAKPIKKGSSSYQLSEEEEDIVKKLVNRGNNK